jgi:DNA-binding response OmpR family regulator
MSTTPEAMAPEPAADTAPRVLQVANVELNVTAHRVTVDDVPVAVSPREFDLLSVLLAHADHVLSRHLLMKLVWGPGYRGDPGTLNVHILRLRHKLERRPGAAAHIRTVHGIGYIFDSTAPPPPTRRR